MINPTTAENLSVSCDDADDVAQPVNYGDYNDGTTVYVFGTNNASVDLSTGFYGKTEGSDSIINASSNDEIYLYDVSLSDIALTASDGLNVGILFNTGNVLTVSGTSVASAEFKLADGSEFWYSYTSKQWFQDN